MPVLDVYFKWPEIIEISIQHKIKLTEETFLIMRVPRTNHYQQWAAVHRRRVHSVHKAEWYKTLKVLTNHPSSNGAVERLM